jgi:endonuclease/exonuclease/phosphatase family metal-dependent hydrolase
LHARLGRTPGVRTFPARRPVFALDRVWVQPRVCLARVTPHATRLARVASDHLPVRAEIAWPVVQAAAS